MGSAIGVNSDKNIWIVVKEDLISSSFEWYFSEKEAEFVFNSNKRIALDLDKNQLFLFKMSIDRSMLSEDIAEVISELFSGNLLKKEFLTNVEHKQFPYSPEAWENITNEYLAAESASENIQLPGVRKIYIVGIYSIGAVNSDWFDSKEEAEASFERGKKHTGGPLNAQQFIFSCEVSKSLSVSDTTEVVDSFFHVSVLAPEFFYSDKVRMYPYTAEAWDLIICEDEYEQAEGMIRLV